MHTTTVRFGEETWQELKAVCESEGVAAAQYIREATIAALARRTPTARTERHGEELVSLRARVERIERALLRSGRRP